VRRIALPAASAIECAEQDEDDAGEPGHRVIVGEEEPWRRGQAHGLASNDTFLLTTLSVGYWIIKIAMASRNVWDCILPIKEIPQKSL
jgi:hypothetical protein